MQGYADDFYASFMMLDAREGQETMMTAARDTLARSSERQVAGGQDGRRAVGRGREVTAAVGRSPPPPPPPEAFEDPVTYRTVQQGGDVIMQEVLAAPGAEQLPPGPRPEQGDAEGTPTPIGASSNADVAGGGAVTGIAPAPAGGGQHSDLGAFLASVRRAASIAASSDADEATQLEAALSAVRTLFHERMGEVDQLWRSLQDCDSTSRNATTAGNEARRALEELTQQREALQLALDSKTAEVSACQASIDRAEAEILTAEVNKERMQIEFQRLMFTLQTMKYILSPRASGTPPSPVSRDRVSETPPAELASAGDDDEADSPPTDRGLSTELERGGSEEPGARTTSPATRTVQEEEAAGSGTATPERRRPRGAAAEAQRRADPQCEVVAMRDAPRVQRDKSSQVGKGRRRPAKTVVGDCMCCKRSGTLRICGPVSEDPSVCEQCRRAIYVFLRRRNASASDGIDHKRALAECFAARRALLAQRAAASH